MVYASRAIYFDGACLPVNPGGIATCAAVAVERGKVVAVRSRVVSMRGTSDLAEWSGLLMALDMAVDLGWDGPLVLGDNRHVVDSMNGRELTKERRVKRIYAKALALHDDLGAVVMWVPRKENLADWPSHRAFIDHVEALNRDKALKGLDKYSVRRSGQDTFLVSRNGTSQTVNLRDLTCTCSYFRKMNGSMLMKRSGIRVRCKHFFVVELKGLNT